MQRSRTFGPKNWSSSIKLRYKKESIATIIIMSLRQKQALILHLQIVLKNTFCVITDKKTNIGWYKHSWQVLELSKLHGASDVENKNSLEGIYTLNIANKGE